MKTLVETVLDACQQADVYHNTRSLYSISSSMQAEMGEVAEEVVIASGDSYKTAGPDGVNGEAIDLICAGLDLLYKNNGNVLDEQTLVALAHPKLAKWIDKIQRANAEGKIK